VHWLTFVVKKLF